MWIGDSNISWIQCSSVGNYVCSDPLWSLPTWLISTTLSGGKNICLRKLSRKTLRKSWKTLSLSLFHLFPCKLGEVKKDTWDQYLEKLKAMADQVKYLIWLNEPRCLKSLRLIAIESSPCSNLQRFIQDRVVYWNAAVRKDKVGSLISSLFCTIFLMSLPYLGGYLYYP